MSYLQILQLLIDVEPVWIVVQPTGHEVQDVLVPGLSVKLARGHLKHVRAVIFRYSPAAHMAVKNRRRKPQTLKSTNIHQSA